MEGRDEEEDEDELEDEPGSEDVETHALAQCDIARSTIVEIAPSRPPNTDESELELELEDEDELLETTEGGSGGGSPR